MKKKQLDIFDILEPATITVRNYERDTVPFKDDRWIDSSDLTIREVAKLLPSQLSFIYCLLHEHPNLLPAGNNSPGRIEELIILDIMKNLRCRTHRDHFLEQSILKLWENCGGHTNNELKKEFRV